MRSRMCLKNFPLFITETCPLKPACDPIPRLFPRKSIKIRNFKFQLFACAGGRIHIRGHCGTFRNSNSPTQATRGRRREQAGSGVLRVFRNGRPPAGVRKNSLRNDQGSDGRYGIVAIRKGSNQRLCKSRRYRPSATKKEGSRNL